MLAAVAEQLLSAVDQLRALPQSDDLRDSLRRLLHRNRKHRDAPWSMGPAVPEKFEDAYSLLTPADPIEACAWLFGPSPEMPNPPSAEDAVERRRLEDEQVKAAQRAAVSDIWANRGPDGILGLMGQVAEPETLGLVCAEVLDFGPLLDLSAPHFGSPSHDARSFVRGALGKLASVNGWAALRPALEIARESSQPSAVLDVYLAAESNRETWELLSHEDATVQDEYWRNVNRLLVSIDSESDAEYVVSRFLIVQRSWDLVLLRESEEFPTNEIVRVLRQLPQDTSPRESELDWAAHEIGELLAVLDMDDSVSDEEIAGLELPWIGLLEHHRSEFAINRLIASDPACFAEIICAGYGRDDDSSAEGETDTVRQNFARLAREVLDQFDSLPGAQSDGSIDQERLSSWVFEARRLCQEQGRGEVGDGKIGELLSGCPADPDSLWPCAAVRDLLDLISSTSMADGFSLGKHNRRGVIGRGLDEGGEQEREHRDRFFADAARIRTSHPFTSKVLRQLAESYEDEARYQDSEAEWRDLSV